jgi:ribose 5-phosphate isomerase B
MKIAIACDHAGLSLKREVKDALGKLGHVVEDLGTNDGTSVDYPDFAAAVARAVRDGRVERGVLICGTGVGMSITANKFAGVRAALCTCEFTARMSRAHNDANVLCLGERVTGPGVARAIAGVFVSTAFEGGRHERRVGKIRDMESEAGRG